MDSQPCCPDDRARPASDEVGSPDPVATGPGARLNYNPALDGLRAVAVLLVILYHVHVPYMGAGHRGVDVFFVLSGFLITSLLLREHVAGGIRLGAFYLRRARRLYPALCALVAVLFAIGWVSPSGAAKVLLYLTDYFGGNGATSHAWSLAAEEHYYLLWPLLLPLLARLPRPRATMLLGALYVAATLWSFANPHAQLRFDTRLSGLVFGSLLAFAPALAVPLVLLAIATAATAIGLPVDRMFTEAATGALVLLSTRTTLPWLTRAPFVYVGRISYGLYLYHLPIAFQFEDGVLDWEQRLAIVLLATGAAAVLSYHSLERLCRDPAAWPALSARVIAAWRRPRRFQRSGALGPV